MTPTITRPTGKMDKGKVDEVDEVEKVDKDKMDKDKVDKDKVDKDKVDKYHEYSEYQCQCGRDFQRRRVCVVSAPSPRGESHHMAGAPLTPYSHYFPLLYSILTL